LRAGTDLTYTPYPPPSKLGRSLLLCEESLEVQPTVDKELVSGGPVLRAKDSDMTRCFSQAQAGLVEIRQSYLAGADLGEDGTFI